MHLDLFLTYFPLTPRPILDLFSIFGGVSGPLARPQDHSLRVRHVDKDLLASINVPMRPGAMTNLHMMLISLAQP